MTDNAIEVNQNDVCDCLAMNSSTNSIEIMNLIEIKEYKWSIIKNIGDERNSVYWLKKIVKSGIKCT